MLCWPGTRLPSRLHYPRRVGVSIPPASPALSSTSQVPCKLPTGAEHALSSQDHCLPLQLAFSASIWEPPSVWLEPCSCIVPEVVYLSVQDTSVHVVPGLNWWLRVNHWPGSLWNHLKEDCWDSKTWWRRFLMLERSEFMTSSHCTFFLKPLVCASTEVGSTGRRLRRQVCFPDSSKCQPVTLAHWVTRVPPRLWRVLTVAPCPPHTFYCSSNTEVSTAILCPGNTEKMTSRTETFPSVMKLKIWREKRAIRKGEWRPFSWLRIFTFMHI